MSVNSVDPITGELSRADGIPLDALPAATDTPVDADLVAVTEGGSWVKKTFSKVWDYIKGKIGISAQGSTNKYLDEQGNFTDVLSLLHPVGTIIESTTCDTMAKVVAAYGGTTWKQHTGYILRGATSGVTPDQNTNDGGADSVTVSSVASHNHTQNAHNHEGILLANNPISAWNTGGSKNCFDIGSTYTQNSGTNKYITANATATNIANGANYTVNTLPKYKNVYIWERTA